MGNDNQVKKPECENKNSPCQHLRECMGTVWRIPLLILVCKGLILRWRVTLLEFSVLLKNKTKWPGQDFHTEDEDSQTDGQDSHYDSIIPNQYTKHKAKFNFFTMTEHSSTTVFHYYLLQLKVYNCTFQNIGSQGYSFFWFWNWFLSSLLILQW